MFNTQWTKFQCHTLFISQDIKQNVLLSSSLESFLGSTSKPMAGRKKKEGKKKIQKLEYLYNEKSFLGEITNFFHNF